MKRLHLMVLGVLAVLLTACAGTDLVYTGDSGEVAVDGYDVVAYFTRGEPTEGSPEYATQWRGAKWHFANQEHLDRFRENPERYAPAFGGHCAYGVAKGKRLASSPEFWSIEDGRLYLNLNADVQESWNKDRQAHIADAESNWPDLVE